MLSVVQTTWKKVYSILIYGYSSNVQISKLRWILARHCLRRVPQKFLVICDSINEYWKCTPSSSVVQHPDFNHYMEFFMVVRPTKLGIIPHLPPKRLRNYATSLCILKIMSTAAGVVTSYTQTIIDWRPTSNHWLAKSHITMISADNRWHNWLEIVGSCTSHGSDIMPKPVSGTLPVGGYNHCRCFMRKCYLYRILHVVRLCKLMDSHVWVKVWIVYPHKYHHWYILLPITQHFKAKLTNIVYSIPKLLLGGPIYPW